MKTVAGLLVLFVSLGLVTSDAKSREVVDRTSATFGWGPSSGPVVGYAVYVSRNGAAFPPLPELTTNASEREVTLTGNFGDSVAIRVTAFDAQGQESPPSPSSPVARFVRSTPDPTNDPGSGGSGSDDAGSSAPPSSGTPEPPPEQPPAASPPPGSSPSALQVFRWDDRAHRLSIQGPPGSSARMVSLVDVAGDPWSVAALAHFFASPDPLLLLRNARSQVALWSPASPVFDPEPIGSATEVWDLIATPDLDGDGSPDVVWRHQWRDTIVAWVSEGDDFAILTLGEIGPRLALVGAGDITGDGADDLIWRDSHTGDLRAWTFTASASSLVEELDLAEPTNAWRVAAVFDLDADGTADLLWQHRWRGTVHAWFMQGGQKQAGFDIGSATEAWTIASLSHPDGDGGTTRDLVWRHRVLGSLVRWRIQGGVLEDAVELPERAADARHLPPSAVRSRTSLPLVVRTAP